MYFFASRCLRLSVAFLCACAWFSLVCASVPGGQNVGAFLRCRIGDGSHPAGASDRLPQDLRRASDRLPVGSPGDKMSGLFSAAGDPLSLPAVVFLFSLLAPCVLLALLTLLVRLLSQTEPPPGAVRLALRCAVSAPAAPQLLRVALIGAPELPQDLTRHGAPVKTSLCLQVFAALSPASLFRGFAL